MDKFEITFSIIFGFIGIFLMVGVLSGIAALWLYLGALVIPWWLWTGVYLGVVAVVACPGFFFMFCWLAGRN